MLHSSSYFLFLSFLCSICNKTLVAVVALQTREYPPSISLEEAARRGLLWDVSSLSHVYEDVDTDLGFLVTFTSLARAVHTGHEKGWIFRDLKERYILIDKASGQVGILLY